MRKKIGVLEWVCHCGPTNSPWECLEDTPFTVTVRSEFVRGALTPVKGCVITLLCRLDLTEGTAVTRLGNLTQWEQLDGGRGRVAAPTGL